MLNQETLRVVQLVERDTDLQILLGQGDVLVRLHARDDIRHHKNVSSVSMTNYPTWAPYLERVVKVGNLAQRIQELVHPRLVVVDERLQRHHVCLF